jgi:hypothetical protein
MSVGGDVGDGVTYRGPEGTANRDVPLDVTSRVVRRCPLSLTRLGFAAVLPTCDV